MLSFTPAASGGGALTLQTRSPQAAPPQQGVLQGPLSAKARRAALLASADTVRGKAARVQTRPHSGKGGGSGSRAGGSQPRAPPRQVPFEDLPPWQAVLRAPRMVVDRFGIDYVHCGAAHWFLTHFHADHYKGLSKHFNGGVWCHACGTHPLYTLRRCQNHSHNAPFLQPPRTMHRMAGTLYCTPVTAALVQLKMRVAPERMRCLPLDQPTDIEGVQVTMVDANHCPGAAMILFEPPNRLPIVRREGLALVELCNATPCPPSRRSGPSLRTHASHWCIVAM